jgi:hypothetical protein
MLSSPSAWFWTTARQAGLSTAAMLSVIVQCLGQTTSANASDYTKIIDLNKESIVHIQATKTRRDGVGVPEIRTGTGFLISDRGYVLTVRHVIPLQDADSVIDVQGAIRSPRNTHYPMEIVKPDDDFDLVLLQFPDFIKSKPVTFGDSRSVHLSAALYALGFPGNQELSPAVGLLSNRSGPHGTWQTTIPINRGNSGGPVFDKSGRVVAIASAGRDDMQQVTYAIPERYARGLTQYASNSLPPTSDFALAVNPDSGKIVKRFTFFANAAGGKTGTHDKVFCLPQNYKITEFKPSVVTSSGKDTKITGVNVDRASDSCLSFDAVVSGNSSTGIGWLGVDLDVLGAKSNM